MDTNYGLDLTYYRPCRDFINSIVRRDERSVSGCVFHMTVVRVFFHRLSISSTIGRMVAVGYCGF